MTWWQDTISAAAPYLAGGGVTLLGVWLSNIHNLKALKRQAKIQAEQQTKDLLINRLEELNQLISELSHSTYKFFGTIVGMIDGGVSVEILYEHFSSLNDPEAAHYRNLPRIRTLLLIYYPPLLNDFDRFSEKSIELSRASGIICNVYKDECLINDSIEFFSKGVEELKENGVALMDQLAKASQTLIGLPKTNRE